MIRWLRRGGGVLTGRPGAPPLRARVREMEPTDLLLILAALLAVLVVTLGAASGGAEGGRRAGAAAAAE